MANRNEPYLIPELFEALQSERLSFFSTVDAETGAPFMNAISWVYALNDTTLRIAVDSRSKIIHNIHKNALVSLAVFASESAYTISGSAKILSYHLEGVPLKASVIEVSIKEVRDVMFYGSRITVEPVSEKTYDLQAAEKLDGQIMAALKQETIQ
ncbi:pyridoxamine 5'-phosphate oxidase family protein [Domibacillus indicus]|uniref:pyridoxamine 5'-phosphate oxidase family protein n=1 Tax=Domibacillus indicus TaxID=1437523 RepID=UPI002041114D|nr:pyridoxamine 5'-phosphate oxidase family protein [Domibacillus indicus]MCM3787693.1 pyridoxamine 5'-phosphate oxidase family protein [Domibacillus indicus]